MTRAPWATHFGFSKLPFSKSISAKDLLDRASHQEAVARIRFCIAESLLGVITGEVGVGKTVAVRAAISQLDLAAHHVEYVANPTVGTRGLYVTIVRALGGVPRGFKAELVAQTQNLLAADPCSVCATVWTASPRRTQSRQLRSLPMRVSSSPRCWSCWRFLSRLSGPTSIRHSRP